MRIVIVSRGIIERMHTLRTLDKAGVDYDVVLHHRKEANEVQAAFPKARVHVSNTDTLVDKRNWILKKLIAKDEWFIGMDDNIQAFTMIHASFRVKDRLPVADEVPGKPWKNWRDAYNIVVPTKVWLREFRATVHSSRFPLVGVATTENPYFRAKRFSNYRFVKTKAFAMQNVGLRFKHEMCHDSYISAACVAAYGGVFVDSFLHHKSKMYEAGGLGNREEREAKGLIEQMDETVAQFDGLVQRAPGMNSALKFRLCTPTGVQRWREENGYV